MKWRLTVISTSKKVPAKDVTLKVNTYDPGNCIAVVQFVITMPGRLSNIAGRESDSNRYTGGTICVDLGSGLIHVRMQVSLRDGETMVAKKEFEQMLSDHGIKAKHYHGDNGIFTADKY